MKKLWPAIIQDSKTGEVLSLFYMDPAALSKTVDTGKVWRYSRSKRRVMLKGATSGNFQFVESLYWDCDLDALLVKVRQTGSGACHLGKRSCFSPSRALVLDEVYSVIQERKRKSCRGSYTASIIGSRKKITEKLEEEIAEFVEAFNKKNKREAVWEAADVVYFVMVALANRGIPLNDVFGELLRRRK
ncbi:MAG: bifunctional phosphoribosyl-AMP cyclohydrolase/phosphoribosyl-ATP diphosphatase HisIE [Candidatus Micrarchaeota archaeon]